MIAQTCEPLALTHPQAACSTSVTQERRCWWMGVACCSCVPDGHCWPDHPLPPPHVRLTAATGWQPRFPRCVGGCPGKCIPGCQHRAFVAVLVASNTPRPHQSLSGGRDCPLVTPPFTRQNSFCQIVGLGTAHAPHPCELPCTTCELPVWWRTG